MMQRLENVHKEGYPLNCGHSCLWGGGWRSMKANNKRDDSIGGSIRSKLYKAFQGNADTEKWLVPLVLYFLTKALHWKLPMELLDSIWRRFYAWMILSFWMIMWSLAFMHSCIQSTRSKEEGRGTIWWRCSNGKDIGEDICPVLVGYDNDSHGIWALAVDAKGATRPAVQWVNGKINEAGFLGTPITLRSDQEEAILALKKAVAIYRQAETVMLESPVRDSKANGASDLGLHSSGL